MVKVAKKKEQEVSLEAVLWNCRVALGGVDRTEKNLLPWAHLLAE